MRDKILKVLMLIILLPCAIFINACSCGKSKVVGFKIYLDEKSYTSEDSPELNINYGTILNIDEILKVNIVYKNKTEEQITDYNIEDNSKVTTQIVDVGSYKIKISYGDFESIEIVVNVLKNDSSITNISDLSKTYDGQPVSEPSFDKIGDGEIEINYYQGETLLETAPTNAGTYILEIVIKETNIYKSAKVRQNFVISKANLENVELPQVDTIYIVYNEETTLKDIALPENIRWKDLSIVPTADVKKYIALYNNKDIINYNDVEMEITITVFKAGRDVDIINDISTTYGEAIPNVEYKVVGDGDIKIEYKSFEAGDEEYSTTPVTEVGKYVVRVTISEGTNYSEGYGMKVFYIKKIGVETPTIVNKYTYNGEKQKAELIGYNEKIMKVENDERVNAGSQKVKVTLLDTSHYKWNESDEDFITINFIIQRAKGIAPSTEHKVFEGVYDENTTLNNYKLETGYRWKDSSIIPTCDINTYPARYNQDITNYEDVDVNIIINVSKKELVKPEIVGVYIYDGNEQEAVLNGFDDKTMIVENNKRTLVGIQQIKVTLKDSINYKWANDVDFIEIPFEIMAVTYKANNVTVDYDGKEHNIEILGLTETDIVTYSLNNEDYVEDLHISQAGEYEIYFKVEGTTISYGKGTLIINKISLENAVITLSSTEYEYTSSFVNAEIESVLVGETSISDKDYVVEYKNNVNEGEATLILNGINNTYGTATIEFVIKKVIEEIVFDIARDFDIYEDEEFEFNEKVYVKYKNINNTIRIYDYELKFEDGSDLNFELDKRYEVYAYYKGVKSSNNIWVTKHKIVIIDAYVKLNDFKTIYNLNEELDSLNKIKVYVEYNNNKKEIFTYSEEENVNCFYVENEFDNTQSGIYSINIKFYNYEYDISPIIVSVNDEYVVTGIILEQPDRYEIGTELKDIKADIYTIYNYDYNIMQYYKTISFDDAGITFKNGYNKESTYAQDFTFSMDIDGTSFECEGSIELLYVYVQGLKIVKDDTIIYSGEDILLPLGFSIDNISVYAIMDNGSEILLSEDDYETHSIENFDNTTEGLENHFSILYNGYWYNFVTTNESTAPNTKISKITIDKVDYTFNEDNELFIELSPKNDRLEFGIVKEKECAIIRRVNLLENGIESDKGYLYNNDTMYTTYDMNIFLNYQIILVVEDREYSSVYTINVSFEKIIKSILVNGKELINYKKDTLFVGDTLEVLLVNDDYKVFIDNSETNKYTIKDKYILSIEINDSNNKQVLCIELNRIQKNTDFEYIKIDNEKLDFEYQYEYVDYILKNGNDNHIVEYKLKNENQKIYYVIYEGNVCTKHLTELKEKTFTITNDTTEIEFYSYDERGYEGYDRILTIELKRMEYIQSFVIYDETDNYYYLWHSRYVNEYQVNYEGDFICIKDLKVEFQSEYINYTYKISNLDNTDVIDYTNLTNIKELLLIIYNEEGNIVGKYSLMLNIKIQICIGYEIDGSISGYYTTFEENIKIKQNRIMRGAFYDNVTLKMYKDNVLIDGISYTEEVIEYKFVFTKIANDITYKYEIELPVIFTSYSYDYFNHIWIKESYLGSTVNIYDNIVIIYNNEIENEEIPENLFVSLIDDTNTYKAYIENKKLVIEIYNSENTLINTVKFSIIRILNKDYISKLVKATCTDFNEEKILNFDEENIVVIDKLSSGHIDMEFDLDIAKYVVLFDNKAIRKEKNSKYIYFDVEKQGTYEIELTMYNKEKIKYYITVNNTDEAVMMSLTINGLTFAMYDFENMGDFEILRNIEDNTALYICYDGLSSSTDKLNCIFKSPLFKELYDYKGKRILDLLNFDLEILESFELKYSLLTVMVENYKLPIYIFYQKEYNDVIITLNDKDFKLKINIQDSGDFSYRWRADQYGEKNIFYLEVTDEFLGIKGDEALKILVKTYIDYTIIDTNDEVLASPTFRLTEPKDILLIDSFYKNSIILKIKCDISEELDGYYIVIKVNSTLYS